MTDTLITYLPAKQPVIQLAMLPIIIARTTNEDRSALRDGTRAVRAPNTMPREDIFEKPHMLNVAIARARS